MPETYETGRALQPYEVFAGRGWRHRFALEAGEGQAEDLSDVTAAVIRMKRRAPNAAAIELPLELDAGELALDVPPSASDWPAGDYDFQMVLTRVGGALDTPLTGRVTVRPAI